MRVQTRRASFGSDSYDADVPREGDFSASPRRRAPVQPARRRSTPESVGDLLPRLLDEVGLGATAKAVAVIRAWDEAVGPEFALHCRPDGVRNGVIHARVRDSSWMQALQLERPAIFARLRALLGESAPRDMRLRIGPVD
jgi:predicted nucleic acid-binding Zn ribbon protein